MRLFVVRNVLERNYGTNTDVVLLNKTAQTLAQEMKP